jgi:hypothetical protein
MEEEYKHVKDVADRYIGSTITIGCVWTRLAAGDQARQIVAACLGGDRTDLSGGSATA